MKIKNKSAYAITLLCIIIAVQCIYTTFMFSHKTQIFCDEPWTYGLANSYKRPHIFLPSEIHLRDENIPAVKEVFNKWTDGEFFRDYLTVGDDERFAYDSVIYNQEHDMHPPLYFIILHTICSFFPNSFSWYYAFVPQLLFLCITQMFLYLLAYELTRRRSVSLITCALYSSSTIALFTFTFIRQYSMFTMWCVMYSYYLIRMMNKGTNVKNAIPIVIVSFLSFMTHPYAAAYVGIFTFVMCVHLIYKARFIDSITFGLIMCCTLALYIAIWPCSFVTAFSMQREFSGITVPIYYDIKSMINTVCGSILGIPVRLDPTYGFDIKTIIVTLIVAISIFTVAFVLRKQKQFTVFFQEAKSICKNIAHSTMALLIIASSIIAIDFVLKTITFESSGVYAMRYISYIAPTLTAAAVCIVYKAAEKSRYNIGITTAIVCFGCMTMLLSPKTSFMGDGTDYNKQIRDITAGKAVAVFSTSYIYTQYYPIMFTDCDKVYMSFCKDKDMILSSEFDENELCLVIMAQGVIYENEIDEYLEKDTSIPRGATKEVMKIRGVKFIEDYIELGEKMGYTNHSVSRYEKEETTIIRLTK